MNQSETYQNCGLQELMNYVKSIAEIETNISCQNSPKQVIPKNENYTNWGLEELMNYVKSIAEIETNISYQDEQKQIMPVHSKLIDVEVTTIAIKTPQLAKGEVICGEKEKVALSPSNVTNLIALIKDLQLSNGNLVKRVTYLSQEIAQFHQDLESYKDQFQKAKSRLQEKEQELAANYQTTEKLTCELAIANQLVAQVQADYNEQSYQLSAEKDNCRDLRTRLNREQQHSLQLKFALEKCLEVPTTSYQLADEMVSKANNEDSNNFAPKAPPIKPWTTQARGAGNQIDLDWERQNFPDQNNVDDDFPPMASPDYLEPFSSLNEDKLEYAIVDDVQVASPIATVNTQTNSPSPLVYPSRPPKGRKSLAAIELPSFSS